MTSGKLPIQERMKRISIDESDHMTWAFVEIGKGLDRLDQNKFEDAYEAFNGAWNLVLRRLTLFATTYCSLNWSITALRQWAASLGPEEVKLRRSLLKKASRKVRLSLLMSRIYFAERAHTLREAGLVHELKNEPAKAIKRLRQSLALSEKLNDKWNRALVLREIGRIEKSQGLPGADEKIADADEFLRKLDSASKGIDALMLS